MEIYADIIVDISHEKLDKTFQYRVPPKLAERLEIGMCVTIPFGMGNKVIKGYVVGLGTECKFDPARTKNILGIEPRQVSAQDRMIELAAFLRSHYGGTMIQAMKTVLPVKQSVKMLEHRTIVRKMNREQVISLLGEAQRKHQTAKARLLQELADQEQLPYQWITGKLGVSPATIRSLEKAEVLQIVSEQGYRNPVNIENAEGQQLHLSPDQQKIVEKVMADMDASNPGTYLIHGITGSGKTQVYLELVSQVVAGGRQAIVLIPEIALTYQTLLRFYRRFGDRVSVLNSTLSPGEKYDQCERAKMGEIDVIIGPRSALFTPFPNIGLIIMDEEHEGSYKSENSPKYHAREMAEKVAEMHGAGLVLGSATPSLEAYYRARQGEYHLFTLKERLTGGELPQVYTVDLREELKQGNRSIFSRQLQELLRQRLEKKEQSILFLNRRGYAGFISCRSCGEVMKCPHCDVSLSQHGNSSLVCHYCGYTVSKPPVCPKCGSKYLMGFKAGTEQIEEKLKELFPGVRALRMDGDTTKQKESYEKILSAFANGEADVLIGTQMIVKGHDFPNVTLVGILAADLSLGAGDFRAGERTFQLLTQAAGRAGRGDKPGEVVIQTYQPEHYAVVHAAAQDYENFYEEEILYRELSGYPPIAHLLAVQCYGKIQSNVEQLAGRLAEVAGMQQRNAQPAVEKEGAQVPGEMRTESVRSKIPHLQIMGPAPATIAKMNDIFRYVFYVKAEKYDTLVQIKDILEQEIQKLQPRYESVQFDFDPLHIL